MTAPTLDPGSLAMASHPLEVRYSGTDAEDAGFRAAMQDNMLCVPLALAAATGRPIGDVFASGMPYARGHWWKHHIHEFGFELWSVLNAMHELDGWGRQPDGDMGHRPLDGDPPDVWPRVASFPEGRYLIDIGEEPGHLAAVYAFGDGTFLEAATAMLAPRAVGLAGLADAVFDRPNGNDIRRFSVYAVMPEGEPDG